MKTDAEKLIAGMAKFIAEDRIPVRLELEADSGFEIAIRRLATYPNYLREGYASEVMAHLVKMADRLSVVVELEAIPEEQDDPDDEIDLPNLVAFYEKFGFSGTIAEDGESAWMFRRPGMVNDKDMKQNPAPKL
ncbi:GNAT family N-acetyltransferase [Rhizobium sp. BK176]|uniref:GNAT family N-acetyltransferase n=1 Tax=Rhizobium sp. BK176 TaxID=2587071 RepID=UPI002169FCE3|nr:GNAT family N-acetyltransferase [Rhizobium sp. BK176]MCS4090205.1 GNAT superfamily N-acetyltransferase [Rhizobium sp. BK176]